MINTPAKTKAMSDLDAAAAHFRKKAELLDNVLSRGDNVDFERLLTYLEQKPNVPAGWNVPYALNEHIVYIKMALTDISTAPLEDDEFYSTLRELENIRGHRFDFAFEYLLDKYGNAKREITFFEKFSRDNSFVLYLRDFDSKCEDFLGGSVKRNTGRMDEARLHKVASTLPGIPIVYIKNPIDIQFQFFDQIHRVECGQNWIRTVDALIKSARAIIVDSNHVTQGIVTEIELLNKHGRLSSTFFTMDNENLSSLGIKRANLIANEDYSQIRKFYEQSSYFAPLKILPTCFWLEAEARERVQEQLFEQFQLIGGQRIRMPAGLQLDIFSGMLAQAILLEDIHLIRNAINSKIYVLTKYSGRLLKNKYALIWSYLSIITSIDSALKRTRKNDDRLPLNIDFFSNFEIVRRSYIHSFLAKVRLAGSFLFRIMIRR